MGLALGALLLAVLPPGRVMVEGDSKYVIGLWNKEWEARDVYLYNCVQIALDVTQDWERRGTWIPRTTNTVCDALARKAVMEKTYSVSTNGPFQVYQEQWAHVV